VKTRLSLLTLLLAALAAAQTPITTLAPGAAAPDFKLPGVDGKTHTLKDFARAKLLVIVFTTNHCPTARAYEQRLIQLVRDYRDKGVALVAISPNAPDAVRLDELGYTDLGDSFEEMKTRARHSQFNFPYLYEGDLTGISRAYGPTATPHAFVFDSDRKLRYLGHIDDNERESLVKSRDLRNALDALLAGRDLPAPQTRAFGCSIKWSDKVDSVKKFMDKLAAEPVTLELAGADALRALRKNDSGKLRLVNFWATWCGPCITEFPELVTINRMYRGRPFELVAVSANFPDEKKEVLTFLQRHQASNRNLLFGDTDKYKLMEAFDPQWNAALPYTVLLAPGGAILYKVQGEMDSLALRRAILSALERDRPN